MTREVEIDRMKSEFISVASHELRTPMTGIFGFSELLAGQLADPGQRAWATRIHGEAERLTQIIDDLLDVSRIDLGQIDVESEAVDLAAVLDRAESVLASQLADRSFKATGLQGLFVQGDPDKLVRVLSNVIDNAVKYSPDGGRVEVHAEAAGGLVQVRISDQGVGIPEDLLGSLFQRFQRIERPETRNIRGTGLGLYIVKELMERMGGSISVESAVGEGTTFTLVLRQAREARQAA